jgi:NADH dehydrogenase
LQQADCNRLKIISISMLGMPQGRGGRVKLNPDLTVPEHPEIFVVGDMGEVASEGKLLPQLGSVAMQSGEHVGRQIARRIAGEETQAFKYWDKGFMATIAALMSRGGPYT